MNKQTLLKYRIEDLRELLQEKISKEESLHSPEILQLSQIINILVNEYHKLPDNPIYKKAL